MWCFTYLEALLYLKAVFLFHSNVALIYGCPAVGVLQIMTSNTRLKGRSALSRRNLSFKLRLPSIMSVITLESNVKLLPTKNFIAIPIANYDNPRDNKKNRKPTKREWT